MPLSKEYRMQMAITAWKDKKVQSKLKAAQIYGVSDPPSASGLMESNHVQKHAQTAIN